MFMKNICLTLGAFALIAAAATPANDVGGEFRPVPQIAGVWKTQVTIRDCPTRTIVLAGPFTGLITFSAGGVISESGPALPNTVRGPGHGTWSRIGRNAFSEALVFQRFDMTGILLGSQEIRATAVAADDSRSYQAQRGNLRK